MAKKITTEDVKSKCKELGIEFISLQYTRKKDKYLFKCKCGRIFERTWDKVDSGHCRCNNCSIKERSEKRKTDIKEIGEFAKLNRCKLLSSDFISSHEKLLFECECGNKFEKSWVNFKRGQTRCTVCTNKIKWDISSVKEKCLEYGIKLISDSYSNNEEYLKFKCGCGKIYSATWSQVNTGSRKCCGECAHKQKLYKEGQEKLKEIKKYCEANKIELLSQEYYYNTNVLAFKCACGEIFYRSWGNLQQGFTRCQKCSNSQSRPSVIIESKLQILDINYVKEYKIEGCKHIRALPFDFAIFDDCNNLKCLIEYDGEGHYKPIPYNGDMEKALVTLEERKLRDAIKNKFCEDNNIVLIRIPYWEFDNIDNILNTLI